RPVAERRIALILSNYPSSDGRLANGVGLDTPAAAIELLRAMAEAGYDTAGAPTSAAELMDLLRAGPTNAGLKGKTILETLDIGAYRRFFDELPEHIRRDITDHWGAPEADPLFAPQLGGFAVAAHRFGRCVLALQPSRGYAMDAKTIHHDPVLPPPHAYLAFYLWLRRRFAADAALHMGKHGNLEWLPGKALALSADCYPELALGPLPHIYPFIANDPGEGTQAKRRSSAVIVSHLTPPLTRAETYGPLKDLEALVDEYYEASGVDPRRLKILGRLILEKTYELHLDHDCGIAPGDSEDEKLQRLDNYLCELKELQIRDGLHIFGCAPEGERLNGLLSALARIPRLEGAGANASLQRALAKDLGMGDFDPLDCEPAAPWHGPRPACLEAQGQEPWRTAADTVERIELLALALIGGEAVPEPGWQNSLPVLTHIDAVMRPRVKACGPGEIEGALTALSGRFLPPGPSGAPTRGRLDVLPTGRNFFSVDTRTVPTETAWQLGRLSADRLITAYFQEHGQWPRRMGLSAWGTSNMRTGGDDIAQALALIGAEPVWDKASRRVTGYKILTSSQLQRPRVDIVFRISGFFRDAFPAQIDLIDSAVRAIAALDEPADFNPLIEGESEGPEAAPRIFGARPGTYGAGVQERIETGQWQTRADLAEAYLARAGHAYGDGAEGREAGAALRTLLGGLDAVVHNQDAREFDLLDSDDFYDFEGGMAAAAGHLGADPAIYHNDHANPEAPKIRRLEQEIGLIVRGRAANPKWIAGQRRHGYKGAADMAQTLTNLFAFAATTGAVENHHFEMLFEAYMIDSDTRDFLRTANPEALRDMAERFLEAARRDLWQPRRNSAVDFLSDMIKEHP
ncbi:MAG: cobaltochelatase subunit CobN, partial [Hyphomicrobiales bacterium]